MVMVALGAITTLVESRIIPPDQLTWFLVGRIALLSLGPPAAFLFLNKPYSPTGHFLFGALLCTYTAHGQWYRPFYEYTFFQALVVYTLLMYPPKKVFITVLTLGSILFLSVYIYRFDEVVLHSKTTLEENYTGIIAFSLTLFGIFKVFSEERALKEQALARFGFLGKHSAAILHDLKSTVAIPRVYTELAEEEIEKGNLAAAQHRLKETLASLEAMQGIIMKLNQMTQLTQLSGEKVALREVVEGVQEVLHMKIQHIQMEVTGEADVISSRPFVFSLMLNLIMNSVEIFTTRKIQDPRIEIALSPNRIVFSDNGKGFAPAVLEKLQSGLSVSTKTEASGLGLYLLMDGVRNMGGKVFCSNVGEGARIEVQFRS